MPAPKILTTLLHDENARFTSETDLKAYLTEQRQLYDALPEDALAGVTVDFPQWLRGKLGCTTTQAMALVQWATTSSRKLAPLTTQDREEVAQRRSGRKPGGQKRSRSTGDRDTPVTPTPTEQPPEEADAPSDTGEITALSPVDVDPVDVTPVAEKRAPLSPEKRAELGEQLAREWAAIEVEAQRNKIELKLEASLARIRYEAALPPKQKPVAPRLLFTAPTDPVVDLDTLHAIAAHYHGEKGDFAYQAFRWANHALFDDQLPTTTLLQWALTPYGRCIGSTSPQADRYPVVTLHPGIWPGRRRTLDVVIHECMHVYILYVIGQEKGHSSHDNPTWTQECMRLGPLLGLPDFQAAPTKRAWTHDNYSRSTPEGCLDMKALSTFPQTLRPKGYYDGTALPWD